MTLNHLWLSYLEMLGPDVPEEAQRHLKRAFYAGLVMMSAAIEVLNALPPPQDAAMARSMAAEMQEYDEAVKRGEA